MGKLSRCKGARGERELAQILTAAGMDAVRGRQFRGGPDSPDVRLAEGWDLHFEVKRTETSAFPSWHEQAKRDAPEGKVPVVVHRKNNTPWMVYLSLDDFLKVAMR